MVSLEETPFCLTYKILMDFPHGNICHGFINENIYFYFTGTDKTEADIVFIQNSENSCRYALAGFNTRTNYRNFGNVILYNNV